MILLLVIGVLLTGFAIATLSRVMLWTGGRHTSFGVPKRVEAYGFAKPEAEEESSGAVRGKLDEVATKLGAAVGGRRSKGGTEALRRNLIAAGLYHVTPGRF